MSVLTKMEDVKTDVSTWVVPITASVPPASCRLTGKAVDLHDQVSAIIIIITHQKYSLHFGMRIALWGGIYNNASNYGELI